MPTSATIDIHPDPQAVRAVLGHDRYVWIALGPAINLHVPDLATAEAIMQAVEACNEALIARLPEEAPHAQP